MKRVKVTHSLQNSSILIPMFYHPLRGSSAFECDREMEREKRREMLHEKMVNVEKSLCVFDEFFMMTMSK